MSSLAAQLSNARAALDQAQAAYDEIKGAPDVGARPESLQLQQATNNLNVATAAYKDAQSHPTEAELAAASSQVQAAQATLDRLTPDAAEAQAKLTALENAKAALVKLQPSAGDRAVLEAGVKTAQVAHDLAAEQLSAARLVAPFAGTVMTLDIEAGEYTTPGTPDLRLADTSAWQIETTDLTELNVAQIKEGMPASVTLDGIPGLELSGHVSQIKPYGNTRQGDIVYTVIVTPDQQDERLRWNMTAKVSIGPDRGGASMKFQLTLATKYMRGRKLRLPHYSRHRHRRDGDFRHGHSLAYVHGRFQQESPRGVGSNRCDDYAQDRRALLRDDDEQGQDARWDCGHRRIAGAHHQSAARFLRQELDSQCAVARRR